MDENSSTKQPAVAGHGDRPSTGQDLPFLGEDRAVEIVTTCARTTALNLSRTLSELGVDGIAFQQCVFAKINDLGYDIKIDNVPDSSDTSLIKVVGAIINAPKRPNR
jgi:hypothetical protein